MSSNVVLYLASIFAASIVFINLVLGISLNSLFSFNKYSDILVIILAIVAIGILIWWGCKIEDNKKFLIVLFSTSFIIRLVWVLSIKTEPISDFAFMYEGAQNIAGGNYDYILNSGYFKTWVYQLGFTMYLVGIIKFFGDSLLIIKVFNVLIVSLIPVIIYLTGKKMGSNKGAKIVSLGYCFYISSIVSTSVLTNQHLATLLFYTGIYLLISNVNRKYKWILIGLSIGIGDIVRPEGSIVIIAIILFIIFKNLLDYKEIGKSLAEFLGIIMVITLVSQAASFAVMKEGISNDPLINKDPLWKFVCGLNPDTKGAYSEDDDIYLSGYGTREGRTKAELGLIKERLSNPKALVKTMSYKTAIMWGANDTSMNLSLTDEVQNNKYLDILIKIEKIQYMILMIMFLGSIIITIRRKDGFKNTHLYLIIFIGYFLAHLLIEVQPRYRYFAIPIIFIIQAEFLEMLFKDRGRKAISG
ncbi:glycosyltransferase family 39 protein [Clostridium gasigenes]|uniref:glycosyltransferase family 39 protein n=1 Tax=Clostridium gasigenes TaxID=94869 RepID=UPI001C0C09BE|nr:glycosyltransferase family 39 protein [Clostridium gasigenes]MBU3135385.1 glycosyltransferase family 39 protein [Clostridium gasigenes]